VDDAEAAEVVALIAAYDPYQRLKVTDVIVVAWALALQDVDGRLAQRAVIKFYTEVSDRPMSVADVIRGAAEIGRSDAARRRRAEIEQRRATDRAAIPPPAPTRDRTADLAGLLAEHRNWSPIGDLGTRRKQARWSPALAEAYRRATRAAAAQRRDEAGEVAGG
jgi:hypothetical protein